MNLNTVDFFDVHLDLVNNTNGTDDSYKYDLGLAETSFKDIYRK